MMDEHGAFGLCGDHQYDTYEVGGEARPWRVGYGEDTAVEECLHLVVLLCRDMYVVADKLHLYAKLLECAWDDAQILDSSVFYGDVRACHGGQTNE